MTAAIVGQLSLFDIVAAPELFASCIWGYDSNRYEVKKPEPRARALVPNGEWAIKVGGHTLVLYPVHITAEMVPQGHEYRHYLVGERLYAGIFIGEENAE